MRLSRRPNVRRLLANPEGAVVVLRSRETLSLERRAFVRMAPIRHDLRTHSRDKHASEPDRNARVSDLFTILHDIRGAREFPTRCTARSREFPTCLTCSTRHWLHEYDA